MPFCSRRHALPWWSALLCSFGMAIPPEMVIETTHTSEPPCGASLVAGGPGERLKRSFDNSKLSTSWPVVNVPKATEPQLSGCCLVKIRAAAPNYLQVGKSIVIWSKCCWLARATSTAAKRMCHHSSAIEWL
jgi:hypothetical protein